MNTGEGLFQIEIRHIFSLGNQTLPVKKFMGLYGIVTIVSILFLYQFKPDPNLDKAN